MSTSEKDSLQHLDQLTGMISENYVSKSEKEAFRTHRDLEAASDGSNTSTTPDTTEADIISLLVSLTIGIFATIFFLCIHAYTYGFTKCPDEEKPECDGYNTCLAMSVVWLPGCIGVQFLRVTRRIDMLKFS